MIGPIAILWGAFAAAILIALAAAYVAYVAGRAVARAGVRATAGYRHKLAYQPRHARTGNHQPRHARPGLHHRLHWPHGPRTAVTA